jgi:hypothetical protein
VAASRMAAVINMDIPFVDEKEPEEWYPLGRALLAAGGPTPADVPLGLRDSAALLSRYRPKFVEAFGPGWDTTKRELVRLRETAKASILKSLQGRRR